MYCSVQRLLLRSPLPIACSLIFAAHAAAPLADWSYAPLRDDLRLTDLFQHDVESMNDRRIGRLRDVLVGEGGKFEAAVVEFDQGIGSGGYAIALMEWSDTVLEPASGSMTVSIGHDDQAPETFNVEGVAARDIIGRNVLLNDDEPFGRISDILVDPEDQQPSGLLVEFEGDIYALPFQANGIQLADGPVRSAISRQAVETLGVFESDGMENRRRR